MFFLLLAQAPAPSPAGAGSGLISMLPFVFIFVIMYYVMLRPQMRRQKEQARLVASLKTGDRVRIKSASFRIKRLPVEAARLRVRSLGAPELARLEGLVVDGYPPVQRAQLERSDEIAELCRRLKQHDAEAVLAISVLQARDEALAAGADAFLQKPFDPLELLGRAEIIIGQEVSHDASSAALSRRAGSTLMKLSSSAALMISGGASRSTSGRGALITKPAASAASTTAGAMGFAKITACNRPRPRTPVIKG
jgi:CheY-like chemotaxis protein